METLFVYGTLQEPGVVRAVTGRIFPAIAALLPGYRRNRVQGEDYPAIVADPLSSVAGQLLTQVDTGALALLDAFEGEYYQRHAVRVDTGNGSNVACWAYVLAPAFRYLLTDEPWELDVFRDQFLERFMATYPNF